MKEWDKITLKGMRFYGYHGLLNEEKSLGQWFTVDVELWGDFTQAKLTDDIAAALDYRQVYELIAKIVEGPSVNLLEHLAHKIAESIINLSLVEKVLVRVQKPQVPLQGIISYAGVEIVRWKNE